MASGQFGTPIIVQYGNASSLTLPPGPPVIDSRVFTNLGNTLQPPSVASSGKLPFIERVTPSSMNAQRAIRNNLARARVVMRSGRNRVFNTAFGYGASAGLRRPAATYGFDEVFKRLGRGPLKVVRPGPTTTTATHVR
jgi:hypothetical protein